MHVLLSHYRGERPSIFLSYWKVLLWHVHVKDRSKCHTRIPMQLYSKAFSYCRMTIWYTGTMLKLSYFPFCRRKTSYAVGFLQDIVLHLFCKWFCSLWWDIFFYILNITRSLSLLSPILACKKNAAQRNKHKLCKSIFTWNADLSLFKLYYYKDDTTAKLAAYFSNTISMKKEVQQWESLSEFSGLFLFLFFSFLHQYEVSCWKFSF